MTSKTGSPLSADGKKPASRGSAPGVVWGGAPRAASTAASPTSQSAASRHGPTSRLRHPKLTGTQRSHPERRPPSTPARHGRNDVAPTRKVRRNQRRHDAQERRQTRTPRNQPPRHAHRRPIARQQRRAGTRPRPGQRQREPSPRGGWGQRRLLPGTDRRHGPVPDPAVCVLAKRAVHARAACRGRGAAERGRPERPAAATLRRRVHPER